MQIKNVRFIMAAITTLSAYAVYMSRVNLSIAIIAMVDDGHQHATNGSATAAAAAPTQLKPSIRSENDPLNINSTWPVSTHAIASSNSTLLEARNLTTSGNQNKQHETFAGTFPASKQAILKPPLISQEKFHWDQTEQGHILGAFFYGYILFQIPGARMAERVGARWIMITSTAGSAIISLVFPLSTQLDSIHLLMVLRFVMGLCQSAFFPAAYVFFCRWLPESERSILLPIMFIGSNMGSISSYIMSSYLISLYGWPSVFYASGMICLLVAVLWLCFGSNGPQDNWLITKEECKYIADNMSSSTTPNASKSASVESSLCKQNSSASSNQLRGRLQAVDYQRAAVTNSLMVSHKPGPDKPCDMYTRLQLDQQQQKSLKLSKSKSANDLNPNMQQQQQHQQQQQRLSVLSSYRPEVIMLETTSANLKKELNNNSTLSCCQTEAQKLAAAEGESSKQPQETPRELSWCKLIKSVPVWVLIFSMYGNEWSQVVLTYELPTYLNKALDIPIEQNGVINSFFQLSYTLASPILSSLGAYLLDKHLWNMRKIHVRKLFQSLATFGQLTCFVAVPICGSNRGLIIMFMFSAIVFKACANAGDIMVSGDLSPEYAGTIFALANSLGNTAGFVVPLFAGVIVGDQYKREQWTPFWLTSASIMAISGFIFLVLGETRRQDYSKDDQDTLEDAKATYRPGHQKQDSKAKPPADCKDC